MAKRWMKGVLATDNVVRNDDYQWVTFWKDAKRRELRMKPDGYWKHRDYSGALLSFCHRGEFRQMYEGVIPPAPGKAFEVELEI